MEPIAFFQWMWMVSPLVILMFIAVGLLLSFGVDNTPIKRETNAKTLDATQKKILYLMVL